MLNEINFDSARHIMVERQIRTWEVLDPKVLDLLERSPRQDYVPQAYRNLAYVDMSIPLGRGQVTMNPKVEARILQGLEVGRGDKVLEVGTGSGYFTSLLASFAGHVYSVELIPELKVEAARRLAAHGIHNVTIEVGDAAEGWPRHQPYDVIVITGSLPVLPEAFRASLAPGGRLIAVVGHSPAMEVRRVRRLDQGDWVEEVLFETDLPRLNNAKDPEPFVF